LATTKTKTFQGLPVLRETTADKVTLPEILIYDGEYVEDGEDELGLPNWKKVGGMEEYSGWGYAEHRAWVQELTGLKLPLGCILATDEQCSEVWLLANNYYKTKCRLIYSEE
jgi:hypothetical protein